MVAIVDAGPVTCTHCGEAVPPGLVRRSDELQFCCSGCRTVHETLGVRR